MIFFIEIAGAFIRQVIFFVIFTQSLVILLNDGNILGSN